MRSSHFYQYLLKILKESLDILKEQKFKEILCLGLGQFVSCRSSKYQLALLLTLKEQYQCHNILIHDPIFSPIEVEILSDLGCQIHLENFEGKHLNQSTTFIYFPHCPNQLVNNYLYCNWSSLLKKSILFTNSFQSISDTTPTQFENNINYIKKIIPYTKEYNIFEKTSSKYFEYFNDISIHIFPHLEFNNPNFWLENLEPVYNNTETELISTKLIPNLKK